MGKLDGIGVKYVGPSTLIRVVGLNPELLADRMDKLSLLPHFGLRGMPEQIQEGEKNINLAL